MKSALSPLPLGFGARRAWRRRRRHGTASSALLGSDTLAVLLHLAHLGGALSIEGLLASRDLVLAHGAHLETDGLGLVSSVAHGDAAGAHLPLLGAHERAEPPVLLAVGVGAVLDELDDALVAGMGFAAEALADDLVRDARSRELGLDLGWRDGGGDHVELALAHGVRLVRQLVRLVEHDADVLALRVLRGISVVLDVARGEGEDGVVASHAAVLARVPFRAALLVDDVARYYPRV